jgi:hypothetical protein
MESYSGVASRVDSDSKEMTEEAEEEEAIVRGGGCISAVANGLSHLVFKGQNRMHNYMYARIKFHTYSDFISE